MWMPRRSAKCLARRFSIDTILLMGSVLAVLGVLAVAAGIGPSSTGPQPMLAIVDAMVVDGTGAAPRQATVLVRDGRVAAIGPRLSIPSGARVIAADGMTLIPGLFDVHEHVPYSAVRDFRGDWVKNLYACLASGVTTVVDFGRDAESFSEVRRILSSGRLMATPHVLMAARFAVPFGHGAELGRDWFSSLALTPEQASAVFEKALPERPDAIKIFVDGWRYGRSPEMASMRPDTLRRLVELAHAAGLPVLTHTVTRERSEMAAGAGVDVLAHAVSDRPIDPSWAESLREKGTCYAPTMAVYEPEPLDRSQPLFQEVVEPGVRARIASPQDLASPDEESQVRWSNILANTLALHRSGARVILGTDAGVVGTYHGWAALRELELMVEAGLSPLDAIEAGTRDSADCLGLLPDRGTIEIGKRADLVLIEGKPYQNIHDIWRIRRVFLNGRDIDRPGLVAAIQAEPPVVPDSKPARREIDDFEDPRGRSATGALWRGDFESGHVTTNVDYQRVWRVESDHSLLTLLKFATLPEAFGRVSIPLSRGAVGTVDASAFEGVEFEARGDGMVRLVMETLEQRNEDPYGADFEAGPVWKNHRVRFDELRTIGTNPAAPWSPRHLLSLGFEVKGQAGQKRFLELDNLRFWSASAVAPQ